MLLLSLSEFERFFPLSKIFHVFYEYLYLAAFGSSTVKRLGPSLFYI